jgi:hypothetical protein
VAQGLNVSATATSWRVLLLGFPVGRSRSSAVVVVGARACATGVLPKESILAKADRS